MAVPLSPVSGGSVQPEYAATSTTFQRTVQCIDGVMTPIFTAQIAYSRTDYLVQGGKKTGIVSSEPSGPGFPGPGISQDTRYGNIYLDAAATMALFGTVPDEGEVIGEVIAALADEQIRLDLIKRGIISA